MLIISWLVFAFINNLLEKRRGNTKKQNNKEIPIYQKKSSKKHNKVRFQLVSKDMTAMMGRKSQQLQQQQQFQSDEENDTENLINFNNGEKCYREILDRNVTIICSSGTHDHGSSKVKLKNIVDYKWETKHYPGRLIAVHIDGKHVAYVINVNNKSSRMEGMIRVVSTQFGKRALIKGMTGDVLDIQFAHIEKERLLASIDINSLYIHKIDTIEDNLVCTLILKIEDPIPQYIAKIDRLVWCPYIDGTEEFEEDSQLLVWSRGSQFQCFNIKSIVEETGLGEAITPNNLISGYLKLRDESITFSWASLSPDGTTLGVGCTNGIIRFYQVYKHDREPRCLHQWNPHNGKPISSFFFLDNLTKNVCELYWSLAITAAENNTEIKVWDCGKWECLQTINLTTPNTETIPPIFRIQLDRTSSYIVITNLENRNCYVLQIINNKKRMVENSSKLSNNSSNFGANSSTSSTNNKHLYDSLVYIKSIAEFPLNWGILSFSILDATVRRYKCSNENYLLEDLDDYDEENCSVCCVVVRMYIVQSKSMQECHILYQPTLPSTADVKSSLSYESEESMNLSDSTNIMELSKSPRVTNVLDKNDIKTEADCKKEDVKPVLNPLEVLFGIPVHPRESERKNLSSSSIISVAAAAAAAPSALANDKSHSREPTPKSFTLMTPDAFNSSVAVNETEKKSDVSSDVLNTLIMLAGVTGQGNNAAAAKSEQRNILNLVNNKIIEDHEHKKLQFKHTLEAQNKFIAIDNNPGRAICENLTSGNSSPSREVQEILSLQEYDKNSSSSEEILEESTKKNITNVEVPNNYHDNERVNRSNATTGNNATNWPKAPDMHMVQQQQQQPPQPQQQQQQPQQQQQQQQISKHSAELQNAANLITQAVNASSNNNLNNCHLPPTLVTAAHSTNLSNSNNNLANGNLNNNSTEITEINMKMNQLIDLVKMQSLQISSLKNEINELKAAPAVTHKNMAEFVITLETQMKKMLEQYFKRYEKEHSNKIGTYIAGRDAQNRELRDALLQTINRFPIAQIGDIVSKVITLEVQRQIAPLLSNKIDQMHHQIHLDVGQRLSSFEMLMKDSIIQACKNKSIIDAFGKSVLSGLQSSLQTAFIESMSSTLIPAYEKSSQHMFKQLHDAFSDGIKEFLDQFDSYFQNLQPMNDRTAEIISRLHALRVQFDSLIAKQKSAINDGVLETRKDVKSMEVQLNRQLQDTIRVEVGKIIDNQVAAMRSQANTPAPVYGQRETIKMLLQQCQYNKAFHQALLANDLSLVEFTLKNADYNAVFYPKCCLEQKVLLSLMQQITADMSNHNELKQIYLSEALLAINRADPITHEHAPKVFQDLLRNCQMFLINNPKSSQCINVRMLMKAVLAEKEKF